MTPTRASRGLSLIELLVALSVSLFLMLAVLAAYSQGHSLKARVEGNSRIQGNLRVGMDRIVRDLRMVGYGVPTGVDIGGSTLWTPTVFYATGDALAFRGDIDGGRSEIICTPSSTNVNCPLTKLRLASIARYQELACTKPGGGALPLLAVSGTGTWQAFTCTGTTTSDSSITVASVTNNAFVAGVSAATTPEQVYYRYVAGSGPPYGSLQRHVLYSNAPASHPPSSPSWSVISRQLTDFSLEYRDASNTLISGFPLDATERAAVRKIVILLEGYDEVGVDSTPQLLQLRSEVMIRNAG